MNPLLDESNFVPGDIQEREVELGDGKKHLLKFKRVTGVEQYVFSVAQQFGDEKQKERSVARLIAACLVDDGGDPTLTVDQAYTLKDFIVNRLLIVINEVNRSDSKKKTSEPEAKGTSGT